MEIEFIKDGFFGIKKGDRFKVTKNVECVPVIYIGSVNKYGGDLFLHNLKGFYKEVIEVPKEGDDFWFLEYSKVVVERYYGSEKQQKVIELYGWLKTKASAEAWRDEASKLKAGE